MSHILALALAFTSIAAQHCPIQFDGRVAKSTSLATFDTSASLFNPSYVFGAGLKWSQILKFPKTAPSLFDGTSNKAVEVTINDSSVFAPSADNVQIGFRRAELLPVSVTGSDNSTLGKKTLHFSVMKDLSRPLNLTHEYQLVFLESSDYSTNQVVLKTGTIIDGPKKQCKDCLVVVGNVNDLPVQTLFEIPFLKDVWHNFGFVLDFNHNTTQVLYSINNFPLAPVSRQLSNDIHGQGQLHFGLLKKPIGTNFTDMPHQGYQESGIHEGMIFGGIFEEDSSAGCVSLSPAKQKWYPKLPRRAL